MEYPEYYRGVVGVARQRARRQIKGEDSVASDLQHGERQVPEQHQRAAGIMYGYNRAADGGDFFPRLSHAHLDAMMAGTDEVHYTELCCILSALFKPGTEQWEEYLAVRVAQRKRMEDGLGEYTVVRNVFPPFVPKSLKDKPESMKVKKYELIQFFHDTSVIEKYGLSMKFITSVQTLAINDPESAAKTLQEKVQSISPGVIVKITAGRYSESRAQCQRSLKKAAAGLLDLQGSSQAVLAGQKIYLYEPGKSENSGGWYIYGPLAYSQSIYDVYKMVMKAGLRETAVLYAFETVKLDIHLHTGEELVQTTFIANVGDTAQLRFSAFKHSMFLGAAFDEVKSKLGNCLPVFSEGKSIASALRISDTTVVVNTHVVEDSVCYVQGNKLVGGTPLGQDLWAFDISGKCSPWKMRAPKIGEKAVLVAYTADSVSVSSEFRLDKVDGLNIYSRRIAEVVEGASGAALVSLSDGALLGIHSGLSGMYMLAIMLNPSIMSDIRDWESDRLKGQSQREDLSQTVQAELTKRGARAAFLSIASNLHALFDLSGVHVGSAVNMDCKLLTTMPPGDYLVGAGKVRTTFDVYAGLYSASYDSPYISSINPAITRTPDNFESVIVMGTDATSPYVSRITCVKQVVPGKRTFMLASTEGNVFPLSGGVVVSMQDAAVLGSYVRDSTSLDVGRLSLCASVIRDNPESIKDDVSSLAEKFPTLNTRVWPAHVASEVLTHSSLQGQRNNLDLARIGDAAARTALHVQLRDCGYTGQQHDLVVKHQSNPALAQIAWDSGLAQLMRKQQGISFPASAKAYADLFEAFLGAVYLYETPQTFKDVCLTYCVIPTAESLSPRLLRRSSSFTGLRVPFGTLDPANEILITPVD